MDDLGIDKAKACGTLVLLWAFTARYTPRGDVGKYTDERIAKAVDWTGDPAGLISALCKNRWIDSDKTYRFLIHDWADHCEQSVKKWLDRNKLRFATKSGRRPSTVHPQDSLPLPLPVPEPEPTEYPPIPPCGAGSTNGNGHPPDPPAVAGGQKRNRSGDLELVARAASARWSNGAPLDRAVIRKIRTALKSITAQRAVEEIECAEHVPEWLAVKVKARI